MGEGIIAAATPSWARSRGKGAPAPSRERGSPGPIRREAQVLPSIINIGHHPGETSAARYLIASCGRGEGTLAERPAGWPDTRR